MSNSSIEVIKLDGELDVARREEIRRTLSLPAADRPVLLDFSQVTYADSTAVAELLRFHSEAGAKGRTVAVVIGNRQFARLLQYAGLRDAFAVFDDRAAALTYLGARGS